MPELDLTICHDCGEPIEGELFVPIQRWVETRGRVGEWAGLQPATFKEPITVGAIHLACLVEPEPAEGTVAHFIGLHRNPDDVRVIEDGTDYYWALAGRHVVWAGEPWEFPSLHRFDLEDDEAHDFCLEAIGKGAYDGYVEDTHELSDGLAILFDPQVGTGQEWLTFSNDKRVMPK